MALTDHVKPAGLKELKNDPSSVIRSDAPESASQTFEFEGLWLEDVQE